ncbi:MAG: 2-phosphosulfolactate phosphatase [bacterium]
MIKVTWYTKGIKEFTADAYIIVDVLRFSTTAITALSSGFDRVYVAWDLDEAINISKKLGAPLAAEVNGVKPKEADLDNSPTEVALFAKKVNVRGKSLVLRSTAGAKVVSESIKLKLKNVFIGSFINAGAVANVIKKVNVRDLNIICAGYRGSEFGLEDFLAAGAIVEGLQYMDLHDSALAALYSFNDVKGNLETAIGKSMNGKYLINAGKVNDVAVASELNASRNVPVLKENYFEPFN